MPTTRRTFLAQTTALATGTFLAPRHIFAAPPTSAPNIQFPSAARDRLAIASYPFRGFIANPGQPISDSPIKIDLKDFAPAVVEHFQIKNIEPWGPHFHSLAPAYLEEFRANVVNAGANVVNIAVDGEDSVYSTDPAKRQAAIAHCKKWIDIAIAIGSPSVRTHIAATKDSQPDVARAAESLQHVAEYGAQKNVVVNLENDDSVSEDPFFVAHVIEKAHTPWLRALPDFANSLAISTEDYNYRGFDLMASHAYNISHVKEVEDGDGGKIMKVDLDQAFAILQKNNYRGYLSMEWDSSGDPYAGTKALIEKTLAHLT